jgi:hypothetical protein
MPLFLSPKGTPAQVLTKDKERIIGYGLTPEGLKQLRAAGIRSGEKVPSHVLVSLIRAGNAHSPRPAESAGQVQFNFGDDRTSDFLPRCEMTGSTADIHLVIYGEGNGVVAKLLSREPRYLLQRVTAVSVPVTILSPAALGHLEAAGKLPTGSVAATTLREWFRQDWDASWEKLRSERDLRQDDLPLS